ncbi:MAG: DUF1566 domain-containing protein [Leptospiraceae bacterium]|nr:DUF1566 domain-containing protein [Leptospiraceae bacterium]
MIINFKTNNFNHKIIVNKIFTTISILLIVNLFCFQTIISKSKHYTFLKSDGTECNSKSIKDCPIVYDLKMNLEWQRVLTDNKKIQPWNSSGFNDKGPKEAKEVCESLNTKKTLGTGWRLPTQDDFMKSSFMLDEEKINQAEKHFKTIESIFPESPLDFYWSTEIFEVDKSLAIAYSFAGKLESFHVDGKERLIRVRCVRNK